jgi:hypothetical protein
MKLEGGMADPVTPLLVALGLEPFAFVAALGLAIPGTVLAAFAQDAVSRGRTWVLHVLLVGGVLLLALASHAEKHEPGIVILCESGGVYRTTDSGFLASGGPCVLHDRQGGHTTADVIVVYDHTAGAP